MLHRDGPASDETTALARIALAVVIVLGGALLTRSVTTELNQTVGTMWPFSLASCYGPASPGCADGEQSSNHEATR